MSATRRIAVYGASFDPPGLHHRQIVEALRGHFDQVIVVPSGPRPDKPAAIDPVYRAALTDLTFRGADGVEVDLHDLEHATFTPAHEVERRYADRGEVWHVVGNEIVRGGRREASVIHREWQDGRELWRSCNFAIFKHRGHPLPDEDLPPKHVVIPVETHGSSYALREKLSRGEPVDGLISSAAEYVRRHRLYHSAHPGRAVRYTFDEPRLLLAYDERNPKARDWAQRFRQYEDPADPNLILAIGGDGTMLHAIQKHWRLRIPFFGINAGHLGFLLNDAAEIVEAGIPPHEIISRPMPLLYVEFTLKDGTKSTGLTFNDAWVERSTGQTAWIEVKIDGKPRLPKLVCDGVLLSTAAGSTAYARSMGATPLLADTPAWLMVGSNVMQPLHWKSALLGLETEVVMRNLDPVKRPLNGFLYGIPVGEVLEARVRVSRSAGVELAFVPNHDITEKIAEIQFPGESVMLKGL